jgi:endonuclease YncB( thermonuclease family)
MVHDFKRFPELTNSQMNEEYVNSPHKQIIMNFEATVVKVHDGDTVTLQWNGRDFNFPMRMRDIDAPELNVKGGHKAKEHLKNLIEGKLVEILIDPENRVEKWGRLLGDIMSAGVVMSEEMIRFGEAVPFDQRRETLLPNIEKELGIKKWLN